MKRQLYPAVLERGRKGAFGAWFPDFPGCVAAGRSQEETIEKAEEKLAQAVDVLFEQGRPLPASTPIERIDRRAAELGMSRSSFFGLAAASALARLPGPFWPEVAEPRSKVHKTGRLRTEKSSAKKSSA